MPWRLYLLPVTETTDADGILERAPKYLTALPVSWAVQDYGFEPAMLAAADLTLAQHNSLTANADVSAIPVNIDTNPSAAAVTAIKNRLEALNIPAGWVTTAMTWREIIRVVTGFMQFMQRVAAIRGIATERLFTLSGVTLSTEFGQLPSAWQTILTSAAASLGYSTTGLTGSTTLRVALKSMADAWGNRAIRMGGLTI